MQFRKVLLAAATTFAVGCSMAAFTQPASARVVCNAVGDCWTTHEMVRYPRDLGVRVYSDRYADQAYRERRWRRYHRVWHDEPHDHEHGAYRNGVWFTF